MEHPAFITELGKKLNLQLHRAPEHGYDPVRNVMACRKDPEREGGWLALYALHEDGALAGLNVAGHGLAGFPWQVLSSLDISRLEALNMRDNHLKYCTGLEQMPNLRFLDLSNNQLMDFELPDGLDGLEHLWLDGNDFNDPVLMARAKQGRHALLDHLRGLAKLAKDEMEELYEARMLIIGEPRAGKTSLRKKLQDVANPLPTASTKGIDVDLELESNSFPYKTSAGKDVTFHYQVWDFGGQRQYHPTHQLFFAKNTLYILVTNTDYDHKNEGDVEFWLETVQKLGEGSPVLRFQNAPSDRHDSSDWKEINRRFGKMIQGDFCLNLNRVNPKDETFNQKDARKFELLQDAIVSQMKGLEHIGSKVTPTWRRIREAIAAEAKVTPHISLDRYQAICKECGYPDSDKQLELSTTFHMLGIFLHYQRNDQLRNTVILQNEWAIDAVFAILDSPTLREKQGFFSKADLPKIWEHKKYDRKREDLLQLLQEFELCYPLPANRGFVAPQCLDKAAPAKYNWDESKNVLVDVTYDFLPRAIITRLLVKMHEHIADKKQWVWQSGAVLDGNALKYPNTQAYIQEKYKDRKIAIKLRGQYSEDLFREIQTKLADIRGDFPSLEVDYLIYCNCLDCRQSENPTPFKYYEDLLRYRRELGEETIECKTRKRQVKIADILSGIISPSQAREDLNKGPKPIPIDLDLIVELIEQGELKEAFEALKRGGHDVTIHLGNLKDAEDAYSQARIDFDGLGKIKARLKYAALEMLGSKR